MEKNANTQDAGQVDAMKLLLQSMIPLAEMRKSIVSDQAFINVMADLVIEKMQVQGLIEDKLLNITETMEILGIKSRTTLDKMKDNGLKPIRLAGKNGHPKYRMSDIRKYQNSLQKQ